MLIIRGLSHYENQSQASILNTIKEYLLQRIFTPLIFFDTIATNLCYRLLAMGFSAHCTASRLRRH